MTDISNIKINTEAIGQAANSAGKLEQKPDSAAFGAVLQDAIGKVASVQKEADTAIKELASGGDITQAVLAMEKADMSFQLMVEVRNKLIGAYEEVMRMQV